MEQVASLDDKYLQKKGRVFLTGIQALTRLTIMQRQRDHAAGFNTAGFISGYRGSPLGGLDKELWRAGRFLRENHIHFQPGVNEDLAATALWGTQQIKLFPGAQYDGVFGLWYGKGPGVDRSGDVFKHANAAGTSSLGGVLIAAGDDHGCKSSTLAHQSEYSFIDAMIPVLNPSGVQDIIDLGLHGWALSRYSGCWVALKVIAETADASYSTDVDPQRVQIRLPPQKSGDLNIRWPDKPLDQEIRLHTHKMEAALAYARTNQLNRISHETDRPRIGIVSTGKSWLDVLQALKDLGIGTNLANELGLRILKVGMSWPLEPDIIQKFVNGLDEVLVVEEKRGIIEDQLKSQLYNSQHGNLLVVIGKKDRHGNLLLPSTGELTPAMIARVIAARIEQYFSSEIIRNRLNFLTAKEKALIEPRQKLERTPHYCSGCPHNTSTVVPEGSRAIGGIGCHYMVTWMDRNTDTFTQMGGEGATWIGQSPFTSEDHVFQNLGDGTYFHSGLLAIRAAVAAKVNITFKILYNDAVAMTGGQPVDGQLSVAQICQQLQGEGVTRIAVASDDLSKYKMQQLPNFVTLTHRDNLDELQRQLRIIGGTSVLIYEQTCAAEKRRRRKKKLIPDPAIRPFINTMVCEGCGDCGKASNCLSIVPKETPFGRKRVIDQSSCNKDMSCIKGFCPSFVSVVGGNVRKPSTVKIDDASIELPEPILPDITKPYGIVIAGIGGTGVTTLGAILGMAAHLEGKGATVLDMTGLAQKFGAVISHLQVADDPETIFAPRIAAGAANTLIGCDLAVAASDECLAKLDPVISSAVVNNHESMTAEFIHNPDAEFPGRSMQDIISESTREGKTWFLGATEIVDKLLGSSIATNLFMAGFAWQKGLIPISRAAIDQAIELNKVEITANRQAFKLGRQLAHNPDAIFELVPQATNDGAQTETLDTLIADRCRFLTDYQDKKYADRYKALVQIISSRDLSSGKRITAAVARYYFKLLAYKDEYEVARLYTTQEFKCSLQKQFEGNYRLRFHLAPPFLAPRDRVSGLPRKIDFGGWILPVFGVLKKFSFLRGTRFDPFALSADRKLERRLIADYEESVHKSLIYMDKNLCSDRFDILSQILEMPEQIRGYGHVKRISVERARTQVNTLWNKLDKFGRGEAIAWVEVVECE